MKIGIVTQPLVANYGGILQNYALQQVLKQLGHEPVTLNYLPSLKFGRYLLYVGKAILCSPFPSRRHPIKRYRHFIKLPPNNEAFIRKNIETTIVVSDYTKRLLKKYRIETIVLGSDQVWRYSYNSHYLEDMFLDFAKDYSCDKITYGASFGMDTWDYPEERTKRIIELVKQFKAVSVREDSGVDLCRVYLGVEAQTVIDPTLLLDANAYEHICDSSSPSEKPYLAAYVLDANDEKIKYINSVAVIKGLNVIWMTVSGHEDPIETWLATIKNADYVITDSYHGSLFSIIFEKQFQTIINSERGSDRFLTLFKKLRLQKCLLYSVPKKPIIEELIDYDQVHTLLSALREDSLAFLSDHLK